MRIWALSDLHLSLNGDKPMDIFGSQWEQHHLRMAAHWDQMVDDQDIVISAGDLSWARKTTEVGADLDWLGQRPGRKVLVKGNHDYWWPKSHAKMAELLPTGVYPLKKNAVILDGVGFFGARGGDFAPLLRYQDPRQQADIDRALDKEECELQASIADLDAQEAAAKSPCRLRICCFHYPPLPPAADNQRFARLIQEARATHCIYGHLHGPAAATAKVEGLIDGVHYHCSSCDQIDFRPQLIADCG